MAVFTPSEFSPPLGIPISTTTTRLESEATRPGATATTTRAFGPASSLAGSQSKPTISRPVSVAYCEEVQVAWSGGESPYSLAAYAPVSPTRLEAQTNQTSWSFYNDFVSPGNVLAISVSDSQGAMSTNIFVVDDTTGICPTTLQSPATATASSIVTTDRNSNSDLPATTIVGIVFSALAFLLVVGTAFWLYRRKAASGPQRVLLYFPNRGRKPGDRSSVLSGRSTGSGRSARSLWSTFSNHQNIQLERTNSVEDGVRVHIDTIQVVEEPYSPMTVPPTSIALFTPRRTTHEWTGYGMPGNVRSGYANGHGDTFNPSTTTTASSIREETTEVEFPAQQIAKPGSSPFSDAHHVQGPALTGDSKSLPVASITDFSERDAPQLSQHDVEALTS